MNMLLLESFREVTVRTPPCHQLFANISIPDQVLFSIYLLYQVIKYGKGIIITYFLTYSQTSKNI